MDTVTKHKKIVDVIEEKIGIMKISELRPNANNTQAVTVTLDKEDAEKLVKNDHIRIGLVNCAVERRLRISKCGRMNIKQSTAQGQTERACVLNATKRNI